VQLTWLRKRNCILVAKAQLQRPTALVAFPRLLLIAPVRRVRGRRSVVDGREGSASGRESEEGRPGYLRRSSLQSRQGGTIGVERSLDVGQFVEHGEVGRQTPWAPGSPAAGAQSAEVPGLGRAANGAAPFGDVLSRGRDKVVPLTLERPDFAWRDPFLRCWRTTPSGRGEGPLSPRRQCHAKGVTISVAD
jgi:hypothetical protein